MRFDKLKEGNCFVHESAIFIKISPVVPYNKTYNDDGYSNAITISGNSEFKPGGHAYFYDYENVGKIVY